MNKDEQLSILIKEISKHNEIYHGLGESEISDGAYDSMLQDVTNLLKGCTNPSLIKEAKELIKSIGSKPSYGKKIEHDIKMGSLNKVNDLESLLKWSLKYKRNDFIAMPKVDGLACKLIYDDGKLVLAATRGDGLIGQDVTDNVRFCKNIPQEISYKNKIEIRGEICMYNNTFNELINKGFNFANPRNAASGSLLQKDASVTSERDLHFIVYDVLKDLLTYSLSIDFAKKHGFETVEYEIINDQSDFDQFIKRFTGKRNKLNYGTDGIVFSVNDKFIVDQEGEISGKPYAKIAYKFPPEHAVSVVTAIKWQVGRTGRITPIVQIEPKMLQGSKITNLSIHNVSELRRLNVCVDDIVEFVKAGDIIPQVCRVVSKSSNSLEIPLVCPFCKEKIEDNGIELYCVNELCPAKQERRILHYIEILDIKGVSIGIIQSLISNGFVKNIPDLYNLDTNKLCKLSGWGEKSAKEVVYAILEKNRISLDVLIASLGIDDIGKRASLSLTSKFKTLQKIREASIEEISSIDGFGEKTAEKFINGLNQNSKLIDTLSEILEIVEVKEIKGILNGKSFCVTGTLSKKRNEIQEDIKNFGGEIHSSVTKTTTYLVAGDNVGTNKIEKARKYGVSVVDENLLYRMMNNENV